MNNDNEKQPRGMAALAALGLIIITGAAIFGLIYASVVKENTQATTTLGTLATLSLGALVALAGAKRGDE